MLNIKKVYIESHNSKSRLIFDIELNNESKPIWFEVEKEYESYLCFERCDAAVIGLLNWAMRNKHDIKANVPITEELLYNINEYLIPSLVKYDKRLNSIQILAPTEQQPIENAGAIGTGVSCGIDSFHCIHNHYKSRYSGMNLTHLCINSVGSFHKGYAEYGIEKAKDEVYQRAKFVAKELGLPLIETNSNIKEQFEVYFELSHTYYSMFAVYCLQKLWKTYYYGSSGRDFSEFSIINNAGESSAKYELLSLPCLSTHNLHLYSEGGSKNRLEKTITIADDELVQKYLHVCITSGHNCGVCLKCKRTLLTLDALGKLEKYDKVFDINYYKKHKTGYLRWLYVHHRNDDEMVEAIYQALKKDINLFIRIRYWYFFILRKMFNFSLQRNKIVFNILFFKISFKLKEVGNDKNN